MKFSLIKLFKSFVNAFEGLKIAVKQQNFFLMIIIAFLVLFAAFFLKISYFEWLVLILVIGLVLTLEIFNTVLEHLLDFIDSQISTKIKIIKDLIAGAIVVACLTAFTLGLIIFLPKIIFLLRY